MLSSSVRDASQSHHIAGHRAAGKPMRSRPGQEDCRVLRDVMNIARRLAEAIRSVSLDTLAGAVPLDGPFGLGPHHLRSAALSPAGHATATSGTLQGRFLSTSGVTTHRAQITVQLTRGTCSPVLRRA